jgi:Na+-translocating ferredoxin:NAD+ oxidoreductase RnfD subunit
MRVGRFFRTPKGILILVLVLLLALASVGPGPALVLPGLAGACLSAMLVDVVILRLRKGKWVFPDGALLTGLFVAMIISPFDHWWVATVTAAIGVASKYLFRIRTANVFNPAALALVVSFYAFHSRQSWWGALPELPAAAAAVLFVVGVFITDRVNKIPAMLAFLGVYFLLVTVTSFVGDPARVAGLYRAPDAHTALFFAFFMVTDPPTSPPKARDQLLFGALVAVASYLAFELIHSAYYLLAGLLLANGWEAWRRVRERSAKAAVA